MKLSNKSQKLAILAALSVGVISFRGFSDGNTAETSALAKIQVKARIQIQKQSDLLFPNAYQGDPEQSVAPSDAGAAEFLVTGEKGKSFSISYPDSSILMTTGTGDTADKQIQVNGFISDQAGELGILDPSTGALAVKVGATRAALSNTQVVADDYSGQFRVRVTYLN